MVAGDIINGYVLSESFKVVGGQSRSTFAVKDSIEYFIKEFLSPVFPKEGGLGSAKTRRIKKKQCRTFVKFHQELESKVKNAHSSDCLVRNVDFFKHGTKYYKVSKRIQHINIDMPTFKSLPLKTKLKFLLSLVEGVRVLHDTNFVHGDLKPDNILIERKGNNYLARVIDYDSCFESGKPTSIFGKVDLIGDQVFYSPEMGGVIVEHHKYQVKDITLKSDIFALGLLFSLYLVGKRPTLPSSEAHYHWQVILNNRPVIFHGDESIPKSLKDTINQMLHPNYALRPSIYTVEKRIKEQLSSRNTWGGDLAQLLKKKHKPKSVRLTVVSKHSFGGDLMKKIKK